MDKDAIEYAANVYRLLAEQKLIANFCQKEMTVAGLGLVFEKAGFLYNEEILSTGVAFINRQDDVEEIKRVVEKRIITRVQTDRLEIFVSHYVSLPYSEGENWNLSFIRRRNTEDLPVLEGTGNVDKVWKLDEFLKRDLSVLGFNSEHGVQESENLKASFENIIQTVKSVAEEKGFSVPVLKVRGQYAAPQQRWFFGVFLE
ncbi:hypothetical protein CENTIMANUS_00131 [Klebsiella phage vB_KpM_Centimanus]